jgi:hypothetical protein
MDQDKEAGNAGEGGHRLVILNKLRSDVTVGVLITGLMAPVEHGYKIAKGVRSL